MTALTFKQRMNLVRLENLKPLNRAAAAKMNTPSTVAYINHNVPTVISLMWWGLDSGKLKIPDEDALREKLLNLEQNPKAVLPFLEDPEQTGDAAITAAELRATETPEDAAAYLLEALHVAMVATNDPLLT